MRPTRLIPRALLALAAVAVPGSLASCAPAEPDPVATPDETDGPEPTGNLGDAVSSGTVADAAASSCATSSVKGLSDQIIAEGQCLAPSAYAAVPELPNVTFGPNVFAFLEAPARDAFVAAAKASGASFTVNSMLRTIVQQYLLYRWYQSGTCGIGLAAKPGNSNHETGLAFDTNEAQALRSKLQAHGFQWFGSADPVHFDYVGSGAKSFKGLDVKAFQRLWNLNHPSDKISEDGAYGPATEARLKKSPAQGFAIGPDCDSGNGGSGGGSSTSSASSSSSSGGNGGSDTWSCDGSFGTVKMADGQYYGTAFGCWVDANNDVHQDPGDNCVPSCLAQAKGSLCAGLTGPECEEATTWFAADAARFGCLARLKVTNPKNGKSVVVVALDNGPSCKLEKQVSHALLDLSYPTNQYLFGGEQGVSDKALVHVDEVDASTPLGPQ
jgi:uncharacterized membrane protein YgcG